MHYWGGQRVCWPPLSNYWGGGTGPPLAPPLPTPMYTGPAKTGYHYNLRKGGRKSKTDPNNYRAITLSSVILKLFERLLLERVEKNLTKSLNWLQGNFRANIGCNMTSVMLRECILYARENRST